MAHTGLVSLDKSKSETAGSASRPFVVSWQQSLELANFPPVREPAGLEQPQPHGEEPDQGARGHGPQGDADRTEAVFEGIGRGSLAIKDGARNFPRFVGGLALGGDRRRPALRGRQMW